MVKRPLVKLSIRPDGKCRFKTIMVMIGQFASLASRRIQRLVLVPKRLWRDVVWPTCRPSCLLITPFHRRRRRRRRCCALLNCHSARPDVLYDVIVMEDRRHHGLSLSSQLQQQTSACPDWTVFKSYWPKVFLKSSQNILWLLGQFWCFYFLRKNCCGYFWATFGLLLIQVSSHTGHHSPWATDEHLETFHTHLITL